MVDYAAELQRQRCKSCWNADGFDFFVPEEVWRAVVPAALYDHVVCLRCFDRFARQRCIDYSGHLTTVFFAGDQVAFEFRVVRATGSCPHSASTGTRCTTPRWPAS